MGKDFFWILRGFLGVGFAKYIIVLHTVILSVTITDWNPKQPLFYRFLMEVW